MNPDINSLTPDQRAQLEEAFNQLTLPKGPPPDATDYRIVQLEEALEKTAEHINLLSWLHAEQAYRLNVLMLKVAMQNPETVEKLKKLGAIMEAAKHADTNGGVALVPGA